MLKSGMERTTDIGTLLSRIQDGKEERTITRFRRIEATGTSCYVLDPRRFRIITDSWNKTDRQDARNMAKGLWVFLVTGEFAVPTVYRPSATIVSAVEIQAALLRQVNESKDALGRQIVVHSAPLAQQITLLVTIPGITPLTASAFLADIGDVRRFKSLRQMNAYLCLVPRCHDSGGKSRSGHITRESRKLTRTILTQSIYQAVKSTPTWQRDYDELKARRGAGRARIAMIRRLCGVMRRMVLNGGQYHWLKEDLYQRKLQQYRQTLENAKKGQNAA